MLTRKKASVLLVAVAITLLPFADLQIYALNPWQEMGRLGLGMITPSFYDVTILGEALVTTLAFSLIGVTLGSLSGLLLSLIFHLRFVRIICAFVRSIHELFWALIFLQIFGLHPLTGLLALVLPYAATFAKVYSEQIEEADPAPLDTLPIGTDIVSRYVYARFSVAWAQIRTYTLYRVECGLRSSAVLGFIGLPTLGYYLESAFMQGHYSQVSALLIAFYFLIATIPYWLRLKYLPYYLVAAVLYLSNTSASLSFSNLIRFFSEDIIPYPLRHNGTLQDTWIWFSRLISEQALPGIVETVVLTQIALVGTGLLALLLFPVISKHFSARAARWGGHALLIVLRSTPEYILAFIFLQLWGPSMLPAVVALILHNGSVIGHLMGRNSDQLLLRVDSARGLNLYFYETVPRLYGQFLAFLLYRWEIIMRETAILGMLGIATLGFYIDSAMQDLRFDRAMILIVITALLNIGVDALSRWLRKKTGTSISTQ